MSAVTDLLDQIKGEGRTALIGYLPTGFPTVEQSFEAMRAMVEAGVDIVEVGIPYSDPVMDGPVIQVAAEAALRAGVRVRDAFGAVRAVVAAGAPAVIMTYYNPMVQYGLDRFAADLVAAGGAGVITPDLTPDAGPEWRAVAATHGLDQTYLVALSSTRERMHLTVEATTGFVYAASLMGVTGERAIMGNAAERLVRDTRDAGAKHVCVGLGVSSGAQAAAVAQYADGVIVGSAFVRALSEPASFSEGLDALRAKVRELAAGVRGNA